MRLSYRFCQLLCQLVFVQFFRGRVFGRRNVPPRGGVILACNHQSYFDPVLAGLALPRECDYMARDTLFRNRYFKWLIEWLNAFPVKRGTADVGAIKETLRRLKSGRLIVVFPEATRTRDGSIAAMHSGIVLIARKSGVPIVPTLVAGAFDAWPRHSPVPLPHPIIVAYGEPLSVERLRDGDEQSVIDEVRRRVLELQQRHVRCTNAMD